MKESKRRELTAQDIQQTKVISGEAPELFFGAIRNKEQQQLADELAKMTSAPPARSHQEIAQGGSMTPLRSAHRFHGQAPASKPVVRIQSEIPDEEPASAQPPLPSEHELGNPDHGSTTTPAHNATITTARRSQYIDPPPPAPAQKLNSAFPKRHAPVTLPKSKDPVVGLDLWEDRAFACAVQIEDQSIELQRYGREEFSINLTDKERSQKIKAMWRKARFPTRAVWVNFHSQMLVQKFFSMKIPEAELKDALLLEAEEAFPKQHSDVAMDYHLNDLPGPNGELCGMMYALPGWELQSHLELLKQAGLMVYGVSVGPCDLSNLFTLLCPGKTEQYAQCLINLSTHFADIAILYGEHSIYSRTVLSRSGPWSANLDYLAENLNDALMYFGQWVSEKQVEAVHISGSLSAEVDICGGLLEKSGIPVYAWNPFEEQSGIRLTSASHNLTCSPLDLANSIALALRRG